MTPCILFDKYRCFERTVDPVEQAEGSYKTSYLSSRLQDITSENILQASLVIRDLTLCVFAITQFREKKPWENCTVILQSPCTVVAWLCGARTSWSHLTSISVRGGVELASPVDVERSSFIFKAMEKRSRPNCDKNGCKCKKQRQAVTMEEKLSVIHFTRFRVTRWFLGTN